MTRGNYDREPDGWIADFADIDGVYVARSSQNDSQYVVRYNNDEFVLEERRGALEEVATLIDGKLEHFDSVVEDAGYLLDSDERRRPVVKETGYELDQERTNKS